MFLTNYFINIPDVADMLAQISTSSVPMFDALWPIALVGVGITLGCMLVGVIVGWLLHGFSLLRGSKKDKFDE
jgi:hypothetical protein